MEVANHARPLKVLMRAARAPPVDKVYMKTMRKLKRSHPSTSPLRVGVPTNSTRVRKAGSSSPLLLPNSPPTYCQRHDWTFERRKRPEEVH